MSAFVKSYNPNRSAEWNYGGSKWRLSRSKIDFFTECPRCFYLDNKLGTKRPGFPAFTLNVAVDELFKREFDEFRKLQKPHPIMTKYKVNAVPFKHDNLDVWRDNFQGIEYKDPVTNLTVSGAVDDIWVNKEGNLIVIDYKSTSKEGSITQLSDSAWDQQYKRQLGVYAWLLEMNGYTVEPIGYLVYANASKEEPNFDDKLVFETTLVQVEVDTKWIPEILEEIKNCLESTTLPKIGERCEYCPYREASGKKLLEIHNKNKK